MPGFHASGDGTTVHGPGEEATPVPHPDNPFEPRARAVSFALILLAACAWPATAVARDGTWAQLGVPLRFEAPLLWDSTERRFVGIGASAFGAADSIEDAWEFREAAGWRRMRLPQPPAGLALGLWGPVADPARRRYVQLAYRNASSDWLQLWALELGPEPHWTCLDASTAVPTGPFVEDLSGSALWVETFSDYPRGPELWSRSLADTGEWRRVRAVPSGVRGFADFVDAAHDRRVAVRFVGDSTVVWLLPLSNDEGWTPVSAGSPAPPKKFPSMVVADAARERLLYFVADVNQPGNHEIWALELSGAPRWELLGAAEYDFNRVVTALAGDTLVLHGQSGTPGKPGARMIAVSMNEPTRARVLFDPVWPPPLPRSTLVPDAARGRWLLVAGSSGMEPLATPLDSLWELKLAGSTAIWRRLAAAGGGPVLSGASAWAADATEGTLYVLSGWNTSSGAPSGPRELWALRPESPPRWERLASGGVGDWPRLGWSPVLVFDTIRRALVCFGDLGSGSSIPSNEVWEYEVDDLAGWAPATSLGTAPLVNVSSTAAYDATSSRVVMIAISAQIATLATSPDLRWEIVHCPSPASGGCVQAQRGMHGVFDPIGRRLLELGGYDPFWPHIGEGHTLCAVPAGDSLGPTRRLEQLGSPGWQDTPTIGRDDTRDALLVFGNGLGSIPNLQEFTFDRSGRVVARPLSWAALGDRNVLRWSATPGATFRLWRLAPGEGWVTLASVSASASGEMVFDDHAIESGTRYGYRLSVSRSPLEPAAADIWLTAATFGSVALGAPWPNPARGSLNMAFTTLATSPADLDVFDIAGRRVWSRRFEAPAPGPHHVAIGAGELPRSGLYFVRLRQAGLAATRRVVLAP